MAIPVTEITTNDFYVVAKEPGAENPAIPTWGNNSFNPASLDSQMPENIRRVEIDGAPGVFQLTNVLSKSECQHLIDITELLEYLPDAAVSLPRSVRHNHNVTWVVDEKTNDIIWQRCAPLMNDVEVIFFGKKSLGLNARYRFYRYQKGDYFKPHTDGAWPGSRIVNGQLITNAYPDRWSQLSFLLFLSDDYEGGSTRFLVNNPVAAQPGQPQNQGIRVNVRTAMGGALCFPHGMHPLHCLHSSEEILSGTKYIIRSDVLFEI